MSEDIDPAAVEAWRKANEAYSENWEAMFADTDKPDLEASCFVKEYGDQRVEAALKDTRDNLTLSVALLSEAEDVVSHQADRIAELEARIAYLEGFLRESDRQYERAALNPSARSE